MTDTNEQRDDQRKLFFSLIIPAHNEEKYIERTLDAVLKFDYLKTSFEVLVIENGSTDRTLEIVKRYESEQIKVYGSEKGVARAKNVGLDHVSKEGDWIVLLDADTVLAPQFLSDLSRFFNNHGRTNLVVGTTRVYPLENKSAYARLWFAFYNMGHALTRTSFAIQLKSARLAPSVRFDPEIKFGEDLQFIEDSLRFGSFFYVPTDAVETSTRRFDACPDK